MKYTCINIQGNLISEDILKKVEDGTATGQNSKEFGLESGTPLRGEIEYAWSRIKLDWKHFSERIQTLPSTDPYGTTLARRWMVNFFASLNYTLAQRKTSLQGDNKQSYNISHTADGLDDLPVHIVGFNEPDHPDRNTLDIKTSGGTSRYSPHGTMQEYLNVSEHLYGMVTNGIALRLMRDSGRLVKLTYIEFDLRRMLEEDKYSEFTILFRLLHSTRFPKSKNESDQCLLEKYYQESIEAGNRIRDGLSKAVKQSLLALGNGLLQHQSNSDLRQKLLEQKLTPKDFYRQLLRLIYRLLFLMVTEERDLIYDSEDHSEVITKKKRLYFDYYSIARLRRLCRIRYLYEAQHDDLWQGLMTSMKLFEENGGGIELGIQPLAGELFSRTAIKDIADCMLNNELLLKSILNLNEFEDDNKNIVSINYRALDVEELGSVYEGLLELHPVIENIESANPNQINFIFHEGTDRKTTGSYYTRPDLVNELIKSALIPVIKERLKQNIGDKKAQIESLLSLKVCDPAAGSGHMLLAAARTIAWELACVETGESNPAPSIYRTCLREVIQHCIYGVDMNPDAVELCKLSLWLESHNSGKPISFLDHKIRCGNSLVGVTDLSVLKRGIPDDAFNPVTGDDKELCRGLKKDNHRFLNYLSGKKDFGFQKSLDFEMQKETLDFSNEYHLLDDIHQDSIEGVSLIRNKYELFRNNRKWLNDKIACNIWSAAFFFKYNLDSIRYAPTSEQLHKFMDSPSSINSQMVGNAESLSIENSFFHWVLEFPEVFKQGGFDVMLGNPPWERIKLQEIEYFTSRDVVIARTDKKSERNRLIKLLPETNPKLYIDFQNALHYAEAQSKFIRNSERFPLTGVGDINTYAIFSEHFYSLINKSGRMSILVPTGIATDESTSNFFRTIVEKGQVESYWGYKNEKFLFPKPVEHTVTFGILNVNGREDINRTIISFCWLAYTVEEANDAKRKVRLSIQDLKKVNPNTVTSPIPRTQEDVKLLLKFYNNQVIILDKDSNSNPWKIRFSTSFHMSNDSSEFNDSNTLYKEGFTLKGNCFIRPEQLYIPLYESKMAREYDHRFGSYEGFISRSNSMLPTPDINKYSNPDFISIPWYWVRKDEVVKRTTDVPNSVVRSLNKDSDSIKIALLIWLYGYYTSNQIYIFGKIKKLKTSIKEFDIQEKGQEAILESSLSQSEATLLLTITDSDNFELELNAFLESRCPKYLLGFRNVARSTDERTGIFSIIPFSGVGNSFPLIISKYPEKAKIVCFLGNLCSIPFDWVVRQKVAGVNFNFFYVEQLPIIEPERFDENYVQLIIPKVLELVFTAWDIKSFTDDVWKEADDRLKEVITNQWEANKKATGGHKWEPPEWCEIDEEGCPLTPFKWDEDRRAALKAELDAIYAKLYGLTTEELRYILDPQDVYGPDFPGETFRVLKEKEIRNYGEYRTKRLVLEAWERMNNEETEPTLRITEKIEKTKTIIPAMKEFSLDEGIYSVRDVVQITHLKAEKVRRWFNELSKENYQGLSSTQQLDVESMRISFHGLIELVVIGTLRENGFTLRKILKARSDLQSKSKRTYPFATNNVKENLKVIEKSIIFKFPSGLVTLDGTGQYNLSFIEQFFQKIEFDIEGIAYKIFPIHNSKIIVIDPMQAGGKAVINGKGVWVESISLAYSGVSSIALIQDQYDLNKEEVQAALEYFKEEVKLW